MIKAAIFAIGAAGMLVTDAAAQAAPPTPIEFPIPWAPAGQAGRPLHCGHHGDGCVEGAAQAGSTHEIVYDERRREFWISGQNWDSLARLQPNGTMRLQLTPSGSGPHGLDFDGDGRLWVTLEFLGRIRAIDPETGRTLAEHDVRLHCRGCAQPLNTRPHGLGIGPDRRTVWFTGKTTGTIGRLSPSGRVAHFQLATVGSVPIYIRAGPDGNIVGDRVARKPDRPSDARRRDRRVPDPDSEQPADRDRSGP